MRRAGGLVVSSSKLCFDSKEEELISYYNSIETFLETENKWKTKDKEKILFL